MPCRKTPKHARKRAYLSQQQRCYYCRQPMWLDDPASFCLQHGLTLNQASRFKCTAEHLTARCDGGSDGASNIVAACLHCNATRHKRRAPPDPLTFRAQVLRSVAKGSWHHPHVLRAIQSALAGRPRSPALPLPS
jgi:hypothetical protein